MHIFQLLAHNAPLTKTCPPLTLAVIQPSLLPWAPLSASGFHSLGHLLIDLLFCSDGYAFLDFHAPFSKALFSSSEVALSRIPMKLSFRDYRGKYHWQGLVIPFPFMNTVLTVDVYLKLKFLSGAVSLIGGSGLRG